MTEGFVPENRIPCGQCCRQLVRVSPLLGDDSSTYQTQDIEEEGSNKITTEEWAQGDRVLKRKSDGHCTYLADDLTRCTIYERRPHACQDYPCDPTECLVLLEIANG